MSATFADPSRFVFRVTPAEKAGFDDAAKAAGMSRSAWARNRLRAAAQRELNRIGAEPPFAPRCSRPERQLTPT